jgi:hypothetical protein
MFIDLFEAVFHGDASPRVGDAGDAFPTSPGQGHSRGDVSLKPK